MPAQIVDKTLWSALEAFFLFCPKSVLINNNKHFTFSFLAIIFASFSDSLRRQTQARLSFHPGFSYQSVCIAESVVFVAWKRCSTVLFHGIHFLHLNRMLRYSSSFPCVGSQICRVVLPHMIPCFLCTRFLSDMDILHRMILQLLAPSILNGSQCKISQLLIIWHT